MFTLQALGLGILILGLSEVSIPQDRNQAGHSLFFVPHCRLSSRTFGPSSLVSSWLFIGKHLFLLKGEMPAQSLNKAQQGILTGLLLDDRNPSRLAQAKVWDRMGEGLGSCCYYSWKDPDRSGKLRIGNSCGCNGPQNISGTRFSLFRVPVLAFLSGSHHHLSSSFCPSHVLSLSHAWSQSLSATL